MACCPVLIRACRPADVTALEEVAPTGPNRRHVRRLARQAADLSTVLVAWEDGVPVGGVEIRWDGCAAPEVAFIGPELHALDVWDPARRGTGIGTALVRHAEGLVRARGLSQVGLGVADDNPRAARLYARLGYRDTGCPYLDRWEVALIDGTTVQMADPCRFLISDLP